MLILVRGLPGSGKSTFAHKMFPKIIHLENDMFHMVYDENIFPDFVYDFTVEKSRLRSLDCLNITRQLLNCGASVIVSNVFTTKNSINRYVTTAECLGHTVKIFRMLNDFGNQHDVPEHVLDSMRDSFVDYPGEYLVKSNGLVFDVTDPQEM